MPAIDTRGPYVKKAKKKEVYGPPVPKKKVYGPPAPKPKPIKIVTTHRAKPVRAKPVYGPPVPKARPKAGPPVPVKSRTPRKPTPAERTNIRISAEGAKRAGEYQAKRPISDRRENTVAAVERYKQSQPYYEALAAGRLSKSVQEGLAKARKTAPGYTPKVYGAVPVGKTHHAKDVIPARGTREDKGPSLTERIGTKGKTLAELDELDKILKGDRKDTVKRLDDWSVETTRDKAQAKKAATGEAQAVMKVIDYTQRWKYATAGAASEVAKGHSPAKVAKAAARGAQGKDKKGWSNVLREVGVPNAVAGVVGFGLDVVLDPTTYLTFGTSAVAKQAAGKAGADAAKRAVAAGASSTEARVVGERAARRAAERAQGGGASAPTLAERAAERASERAAKAAPAGKGISVRFAGHEIPHVTRGTAAVGRAGKAAGRKLPAPVRRVPGKLRTGLRVTVAPSVRPGDVAAEQFVAGRQALGRARAHVKNEEARGVVLVRELKAAGVPDRLMNATVDAVERNRLGKLPAEIRNNDEMRAKVHNIRSALRGAEKQQRRAGTLKGKVGDPNYLTSADLKRLRRTINSEEGAQARRVASLEGHEQVAAHREAVALESAKGTATREAAVATERARGKLSKAEAVDVERARGGARVLTEKQRRKIAVSNERAKRGAAVSTERARADAAKVARAEQHRADVEFERAHAGARVSVAKPASELRDHQRNLLKAKGAHDTAKTSLRRANAHLKRVLARPGAQRKHIASAYAKVARAEGRESTARVALHGARATLSKERQRLAGVAPAEADRLRKAIEGRGRVTPAPVERVTPELAPKPGRVAPEPTPRQAARAQDQAHRVSEQRAIDQAIPLLRPLREAEARTAQAARRPVRPKVEPKAPGGRRLEKAGERRQDRQVQLDTARARRAAAAHLPSRLVTETHEAYLRRLIEYTDTHDLPLIKARAEKLLAKKPPDLAKGYYPRDFDDRILKQLGITPKQVAKEGFTSTGMGRKVSRVTAGYRRADQRRLVGVNKEREAADQAPFSTDMPLTVLNHLKQAARAVSQGEFHKELAGIGRPVKITRDADGKVIQPKLADDEAIYKLGFQGGDFGLHIVNEIPNSSKSGQYVALNHTLAEEMMGAVKPMREPLPGVADYDRLTGGLKRVMTATLGFHVRNMISDINQSYLVTPGHKLPGNIKQAGTASRRAHQQGLTWRPTSSDKTIPVAGKDMPVDEFLKGARKEGVLDSGYIGRELSDLGGEGATRASDVKNGRVRRIGQKLDRAMTSRENLMRLATYKAGLDKGLSSADAATVSKKIHVDYGDLTPFERELMRRVFPFYTWTARSLPLAAETFVKTPGKYGNVEKLRQEIGKTTSGKDEDEQRAGMTENVQRGYPVVVGDQAVGLGLPQGLLGELPAGPLVEALDMLTPGQMTEKGVKDALGDYQKELGRFGWGMLHQVPRAVMEWHYGRNTITKADLEKPDRPLVAAPAWVSKVPKRYWEKLDIQPPKGKGEGGSGYTDSKTGKASWGWRGKADWGYDQVMLGLIGQAAAVGGSGRSQTTTTQALAALGGVRLDPLNKVMQEKAKAQSQRPERDRINRRLGVLNQTGINAEHPTAEYRRLRKRINEIEGAKKAKQKSSSGGGFSGFGGGGSSSSGASGGGFAGF